jgi:predicted DNA-binding protein
MIINFYLPESDSRLIDHLRSVSGQKKRSLSFIVREALEYYLLNVLHLKEDELHKKKEGEK